MKHTAILIFHDGPTMRLAIPDEQMVDTDLFRRCIRLGDATFVYMRTLEKGRAAEYQQVQPWEPDARYVLEHGKTATT